MMYRVTAISICDWYRLEERHWTRIEKKPVTRFQSGPGKVDRVVIRIREFRVYNWRPRRHGKK